MKPSEPVDQDWEEARNRVIGLGERSVHKNYYPELRRNLADLKKLMLAVEQTTVGIVICNRAGVIEFVNSAMCVMTGYAAAEMIGDKPSLYRSAETSVEVHRQMWAELKAGRSWKGELLNRRKSGEHYWIRLSITPVRDETGAVTHFVGINEDITERIRAEENQKLLIDELNHRVKNSLAVVQAIAAQTLRRAATPDAFCAEFEARLMALSRTHNLLNRSAWNGAALGAVLAQALAPYAEGVPGRLVFDGADVVVTADSAVTLGMAFHELAVNAAKYGAFSLPMGRVEVHWDLSGERPCRQLHLDWRERGGPPVRMPERKGFGVALLERGLARQLGGRVNVDFPVEGLHCRMDLPLARLVGAKG